MLYVLSIIFTVSLVIYMLPTVLMTIFLVICGIGAVIHAAFSKLFSLFSSNAIKKQSKTLPLTHDISKSNAIKMIIDEARKIRDECECYSIFGINGLNMIVDAIDSGIRGDNGFVERCVEHKMSVRKVAMMALYHETYREIACGRHFVYRGILNQTGEGLLDAYKRIGRKAVAEGFLSEDEFDAYAENLLEEIKKVG